MESPEVVHLVTDGSADAESQSAGAAFIVQNSDRRIRIKGNAFLGPASSVEAEMIAGVLGVVMVRRICELGYVSQPFRLVWLLDHQPTIDALHNQLSTWKARDWQGLKRTGPRHLALWRLLDEALSDISCTARHVGTEGDISAHTACDRASRWARKSAKRLLAQETGAPVGRMGEHQTENAWRFLDARELMQLARDFPENTVARDIARSITKQISVERRLVP